MPSADPTRRPALVPQVLDALQFGEQEDLDDDDGGPDGLQSLDPDALLAYASGDGTGTGAQDDDPTRLLSASALAAEDPAVRLDWLLRQLPGGGARTPTSSAEARQQAARVLAETFLTEMEARAMEARHGGLRLFVERAWPILEPATPFVPGYHVDAICAHLEAVTRGEILDLLVLVPPRTGKALDVDTPILTTWGWTTHGALRPGDFVFGLDGQPHRVEAVTQPFIDKAYTVTFDDGGSVVAGQSHEWDIGRDLSETPRVRRPLRVETKDLRVGARPDSVDLAVPVAFPPRCLLIDPYTLGAWLGDGASTSGCIYAGAEDAMEMAVLGDITAITSAPDRQDFYRILVPQLQVRLRVLLGNKHIPEDYLESSIDQRYALLQGLMDTDGCADRRGRCAFITKFPALAEGMYRLLWSLGIKAHRRVKYKTLRGQRFGPYTELTFTAGARPVFRLARKQNRVRPRQALRARRRYVKSCVPVGRRQVNCIQVEGGQYLAGHSLIPTHNSLIIGVLWPAWEWGPAHLPSYRWIFNTYAQDLSVRDSGKRRLVMSHPWYQQRWASRFTLGRDRFRADNALRYENNHGGFHLATSVNGGNIGEGGNRLVADDPNDLRDIYSEIIREGVIRWWCEVMATRRNNAMAARIVVQQRGHMRDLAGAILEQGGYTVLRLPNEFDPKRICVTNWYKDPRKEPGELLCPARISAKQTAELKVSLGEFAYEAQFQQNPVPPEGGILKRKWWRYWAPAFHELVGKPDENGRPILPLPRVYDQRLHTWDMSFKKTATGSFVCGLAWARRHTSAYLLGMFHDRVGIVDTIAGVEDLLARFPAPAVYVEGKANGPAVIDSLRLSISGLVESDVEQSKEARAHAIAPRVQAGNFVLPHPDIHDWVTKVQEQCQHFPNAAHDDIVDCITLADRYLFLRETFTDRNFAQGIDHGL